MLTNIGSVACWNDSPYGHKFYLYVRQVDEVKNIMVENIEKVLERGEKIELLVDKTDDLRYQVC